MRLLVDIFPVKPGAKTFQIAKFFIPSSWGLREAAKNSPTLEFLFQKKLRDEGLSGSNTLFENMMALHSCRYVWSQTMATGPVSKRKHWRKCTLWVPQTWLGSCTCDGLCEFLAIILDLVWSCPPFGYPILLLIVVNTLHKHHPPASLILNLAGGHQQPQTL